MVIGYAMQCSRRTHEAARSLKCGFNKKLLLYECNSDPLPTFCLFGVNATANPSKSDDRMKQARKGFRPPSAI